MEVNVWPALASIRCVCKNLIYAPRVFCLCLEPRDTQSGDIHAVLGVAAGIQPGGNRTGDHRAGDDRRRRLVCLSNDIGF